MASSNFYRLEADSAATSRWYLKAPLDPMGVRINPRLFTEGLPVGPMPSLTLPLRQPGKEVGFNFCDFDMVVTPAALNAELQAMVGPTIQRFPVAVGESKVSYEILNVCELVPCLDEERSLVTKWIESDGRPDRTGQYRAISGLRIDPRIADEHRIFRVAKWPIALIVSERVKRLFEDSHLSGIKYDRVD